MCPTERELFLGDQRPDIRDHLSACQDCADVLALVRRAVADRDALALMSEEEVDRVTGFVVALIRDPGV